MARSNITPDYVARKKQILTAAAQNPDNFYKALETIGLNPTSYFESRDGVSFFIKCREKNITVVVNDGQVVIEDIEAITRIRGESLSRTGGKALKYLQSLDGYDLVSSGSSTAKFANNGEENGKYHTISSHYDSGRLVLPLQVRVGYVPDDVPSPPFMNIILNGRLLLPEVIKSGIYLTATQGPVEISHMEERLLADIQDPEKRISKIEELKEESNLSQLVSLLS